MDEFMRIDLRGTMKCVESEESPVTTNETVEKLSCYIDANVKHLLTGLKSVCQNSIEW